MGSLGGLNTKRRQFKTQHMQDVHGHHGPLCASISCPPTKPATKALSLDKRRCSCSSPRSSVALRGQKMLQLQFSAFLRGPPWTKDVLVAVLRGGPRTKDVAVAVLRGPSWPFVALRGPSWTKDVAVAVLRGPSWPFVDKRCCCCSSSRPSADINQESLKSDQPQSSNHHPQAESQKTNNKTPT